MHRKLVMTGLLVSLALASGSAHATENQPQSATEAETPHIFATSWGITLANDETGFYNDFARFVFGPLMTTGRYHVAPYKRAMRQFQSTKGSCVYPKSIDALLRTGSWEDGNMFIESDAVLKSPLRIFSAPLKPIIASREDLRGIRLAYALGSRVPNTLGDGPLEYVPVADEVDKAKLLDTGLVDAMIANMPDALFVFRSLNIKMPPYDPDFDPIPVPRIRLVCHDAPVSRQFIQALNARVEKLKASGEMADFLTENGLNPAKYLP